MRNWLALGLVLSAFFSVSKESLATPGTILDSYSYLSYSPDMTYDSQTRLQLPLRAQAGYGIANLAQAPASKGQNWDLANTQNWDQSRTPKTIQPIWPACGPSRLPNTLDCVDLRTGSLLQRQPIPGRISTTPVFHDDSWVFGTTEGFLVSTKLLSSQYVPLLAEGNFALWGGWNRQWMQAMRHKKLTSTINLSAKALGDSMEVPPSWRWYFVGSQPFVGKPLVHRNKLLIQTQDHFLHSVDIKTGKINWVQRLSPETNLRLENQSIVASHNQIIVGAENSEVWVLDEATGSVQYRIPSMAVPNGQFKNIVSAVGMVESDHWMVSYPDGPTVAFKFPEAKVTWQTPEGSISDPVMAGEAVFLGSTRGEVLKLNGRTGQTLFKTHLGLELPIKSLVLWKSLNQLVVMDVMGKLYSLDASSGKVLTTKNSVGQPISPLSIRPQGEEVCYSTVQANLHCISLL